ncbi:LacI family DNA-binding transcriptional regulator [Arthrobacter sp. NyZ413]|uniref:LacI family DNA-binding transcriptional regulator n=1 Tax=Arthrobacter sp. NyZ413 TaxID=3144669 RepID=UPI003BF7CA34
MKPTKSSKSRRPTLYDVAKRAAVSPSLVSLVLQNPSKVSDKRRAAVQAAMSELGYRPSRAAATLASSRTHSIGLVIDDYRNLWFVDLLRGMESVLSELGYQVTLADSRPGADRFKEAVDNLLSLHVEGLVIAADSSDATQSGSPASGPLAAGSWVPTVVAGWRTGLPPDADLITNDDDGGGSMAVQHLLDLGHTRIGHVSGTGGAAAHRREGYLRRMLDAGLAPNVVGEETGTSEEDGYSGASWLLDHFPETTAIFAANDTMALGVLAALKVRGLSVPGDVSVIGYDNSPLAKSRYLEITSVDNRSDLVGIAVARALLERIQDASVQPRKELIEPSLVVRETTGRARNVG